MIHADDAAGIAARSPFEVPKEGWLAILKRTWAESGDDNIAIIAAGVAFYAFAAIVPLLAAVVLSYGLFAEAETVQRNVTSIFSVMPREAASIVSDQLLTVVDSSKGKQGLGLVLALVIALYGATKGASAIVTGLNVAYDTKETRSFIRTNILYFLIVLGGVGLVFLAMLAVALFAFLESLIPGAPTWLLLILRALGYVVLAGIVVTAAAVLFRVGPDLKQPRWIWLSPGSIGATVAWLVGTAGFGIYAANFGNYGATYGSLSAVIVLLTWLWLSAYVFLLGAELNAELERQVAGAATGENGAQILPETPAPAVATSIDPIGSGIIAASALRGRSAAAAGLIVAAALLWRRTRKD
ncbi:YihY/virulence factor BrkB family protein [Sphingomonas floccifaciens]|uniref:YihY/virulence factor BrkB family protein n=1 Tax=Sphingomonas floccifaciens TaxID=1844115 RepID=A0ABW4NB67_9SPHN